MAPSYSCLVALLLPFASFGFQQQHTGPALRIRLQSKAKVDEALEPVIIPTGSIVEFESGKGKKVVLGVVCEHSVKSKGGVRYEIKTADSHSHAGVAPTAIHFASKPPMPRGGSKAPVVADPMVRLAAFESVMKQTPMEMVDPAILEICWEVAADEEPGKEFSVDELTTMLEDETATGVALYRTFRLLTSKLGRVFFTSMKHGTVQSFKARAADAVGAAKKALCSGDDLDDATQQYCLA